MIKIYRIEYKDAAESPRHYTTLAALAEDNPREQIGVSVYTLQRIDFGLDEYAGKKCKITRFEAYNRSDIIKRQEHLI